MSSAFKKQIGAALSPGSYVQNNEHMFRKMNKTSPGTNAGHFLPFFGRDLDSYGLTCKI